mgnify:CR=1 FL=1
MIIRQQTMIKPARLGTYAVSKRPKHPAPRSCRVTLVEAARLAQTQQTHLLFVVETLFRTIIRLLGRCCGLSWSIRGQLLPCNRPWQYIQLVLSIHPSSHPLLFMVDTDISPYSVGRIYEKDSSFRWVYSPIAAKSSLNCLGDRSAAILPYAAFRLSLSSSYNMSS